MRWIATCRHGRFWTVLFKKGGKFFVKTERLAEFIDVSADMARRLMKDPSRVA